MIWFIGIGDSFFQNVYFPEIPPHLDNHQIQKSLLTGEAHPMYLSAALATDKGGFLLEQTHI